MIGVRVFLVHAKNEEARTFYTQYRFEESPTDPLHLMTGFSRRRPRASDTSRLAEDTNELYRDRTCLIPASTCPPSSLRTGTRFVSSSAALTAKPSTKRADAGSGQSSTSEEAEREKRRRPETTERHLPQLVGLVVRVSDEGDPVPVPAQADDPPAHRSSSPGVTELMQERGASHDADSPDQGKAVTPRHLTPSLPQWSYPDSAERCSVEPTS